MKLLGGAVLSYIRRTDRTIWLLCLILSGFSLVLMVALLNSGFADVLRLSRRNVIIQGLSVLLGIFSAVIISLFDYKTLAKLWKFHVPVSYFLVLLTFFIGIGAAVRPDDWRWLILPGLDITFQPAELLRISFIIAFAYHIYKVDEKINHPLYLASLLVHGAVPVVLTQLQGDSGTALIIAAIVAIMLFSAGLSWKYMAGAAVVAGTSLPIIWNVILNPFQQERILAIFGAAEVDIQGIGWQQHWARIALASGGQGGRGFFGVSHTYVAEMHNDFIFAFLGEATGFVGTILTITVMVTLWMRILRCAGKAKDMLGHTICMGMFAMFSFQALINIGMNISMLPVIGNTLPFISYGGSSMLTSFLGIGPVLSVYMHSEKSMFE